MPYNLDMSSFVGQERARLLLAGMLDAGHSPTSMLFSGPPGLGKTTLALIFARALMCEGAAAGGGLAVCGECFPCRAIKDGPFSDFTFVYPRTKQITVDTVKDDYDDFATALRLPQNARHRVVFIDSAHTLNETTSNMMLKLFEEAPDKTVFILVTDHPYDLLPTVRSRCEETRLSEESPELIERELAARGADGRSAKGAAKYAQGKWVLAETLANASLRRIEPDKPKAKPRFEWVYGGAVESDTRLLTSVREMFDLLPRFFAGYSREDEFIDKFLAICDGLAAIAAQRELKIVRWTLPDKELMGDMSKKAAERWKLSATRENEIYREAEKTALDWIREAIVASAKTNGADDAGIFRRARAIERAETWIDQNVNADYILSSLAAGLGTRR